MKKAVFVVLTGCMAMICSSCQKASANSSSYSVTLTTMDPGHFHAALVQKSMYPQVNPNVYVYAPAGDDLNEHLKRIDGYNTRAETPTAWKQHVYTGADYQAKLLEEKKGNVVVLSGNNKLKTEYIKNCVDAKLNVLADKPMCIDAKGFELLKKAFESAKANNVLLYDIMTERYEITTILQKELAHTPEVFGQLKPGTEQDPSIVKESVHHFSKIVSGSPLKRPPWFFDTTQQGEGIVDVTTHLVDLSMWEAFPEQAIDYAKDINIVSAWRWPTLISKEQFSGVTRLADFPDYLKPQLNTAGQLQCFANGQINYTLRGIHTKVAVTWAFEAPAGGSDTHYSIMKGTKANVIILQGAEQKYKPELYVEPAEGVTAQQLHSALFNAIIKLQPKYPGIMAMRENNRFKIAIPESYRVGHEAHFAQVTEKYLKYLGEGKLPDWETPNMIAKYQTTTTALSMAKTGNPQDSTPAAAAVESGIRFGICTGSGNGALLKENGYDYIEEGVQSLLAPKVTNEQFAQKVAQARAAGIPIYACNGYLPGDMNVTGPETKHDAIVEYSETVFRRAKEAGVRRIVFGSGKARQIPDGFDRQKARGQFVDLLKQLGPIAARYDVIVVIEPLRSGECNFVNTVVEGTAIARDVNHPNIKVLADFYHMAQENEGPEAIAAAGAMLQHCHIAEKEKRTAPGIAGDDFTPYFKALRQINYAGGVSIEGGWGEGLQKNIARALATMKTQAIQQ
ncbi:MAG: TIM barrel protein [Sedimentisphaerales bacterium]|nr:TIM barrel protein [Sedimentisphaerales bacterium]